ncbi:conserved hypothetical protein [Flavobacterium sp. 9AF]|uniref:STM3941 family protein n=1 Tax=Flavobacterium sp. 9AF TaxID=2653142 RepID=UPI0012EF0E4B|nr:STM3941 family protein [Flavobacterium sp. 9AF]VXB19607.1 conserved hypothetical protein [Flavobacterium sp. 9AF]
MENRINFNKKRIVFGILFIIVMLSISIWFILEPKIFIRNFLMKEWHITLLGIIAMMYFLALLYSFLNLVPRSYALIITEEFFIDNSKYETIGKIRWDEIYKIKRIKKNCIQIFLKKGIIQRVNNNLLKKFLRWSHNWDYKNSIIISSALLECDIDYLEKKIMQAYKKSKRAPNSPRSSN